MARTPFEIQKAVIFALFIRELKTRFGTFRLGYLWAILEPLAHVVILSAIWTLLGSKDFHGIPIVLFLTTAIVPYLFFSKSTAQCLNAIESNRNLFNYRQVRPFDTVVARVFLEAIVYLCSYIVVLFGAGWFFGYNISVVDPLRLILINTLLFLMTFGFSLLFSVYGALYPELMKFVPIFLFRLLYFVSGIMYPLSAVPTEYHRILLINPLLHIIELNHYYYFKGYIMSDAVSITYVLLITLATLTFGLLSYRVNWIRMVST